MLNRRRLRFAAAAALVCLVPLSLPSRPAEAYPLDAYARTGITRLEHQRLVQVGELQGGKRPPGERLPTPQVVLRLLDRPDFVLPPSDEAFARKVRGRLGAAASRYGISVLDLSDPNAPLYAEIGGDRKQNPGSVGKVLVALAVFQVLADVYPDDIAARERVLRDAMIVADGFSHYDHHTVRLFDVETRRLTRRPLRDGDTASLWTYLDWMMSPSSNSAAGMIQKHLILLAHYRERYPVSREDEDRFFKETPRPELSAIFEKAIQEPVTRAGLDLEALRQGSFLTREGKRRVPGTSSHATSRELMRFLVKMEQGKLVDPWASLEIKRLLYVTERRIRYGSSGVLRNSAVYFKSGSLYSCAPEPGFVCKKYHGNKRNFMNSAAIIETPAGQNQLFYLVTVLSNVLRKNSAADHRALAAAVHGLIQQRHPQPEPEPGALPAAVAFGEGFIGYAEERRKVQRLYEIQEALLELDYGVGTPDGIAGSQTARAIRAFQKKQGLKVTGTPSEPVLEALQMAVEEKKRAELEAQTRAAEEAAARAAAAAEGTGAGLVPGGSGQGEAEELIDEEPD